MKKLNFKYLLIFILLVFLNTRLFSQGTSGGVLLKMPVGSFMNGNEFFSSTGYGSGMHAFYMPSVIGEVKNLSTGIHYHKIGFDLNYFNGILIYPVMDQLSLGVGIKSYSMPAIDHLENFNKVGSIDVGSMAIPLLLSYKINRQTFIGLKIQYYNEKLDKYSANNFNFGINGKINQLFNNTTSIAIGVQNIGGGLKFYKESSPLPLLINSEIKYLSPDFPFGVLIQVNKFKDEKIEFGGGAEYQYNNMIFCHVGYTQKENLSQGIEAGFGINKAGFKFCYDYEPTEYFDDMHKLSIYAEFSIKKKKQRTEDDFIPLEIVEDKEKTADIIAPPDKLKHSYFNEELLIEWDYDILENPDVYFEVYATLNKNGKWIKISKGETKNRSMTFKPTKKGVTFYFKILAIKGKEKSKFSKIIKVKIK